MLASPSLSFTIPSVHDDLPLECRIYLPTCLTAGPSLPKSGWRKRATIVAHPYAPLGGCYDDPVVDIVGSTILNEGFIVGTFNFRGAGSSRGRTSWSSRPEQDDYLSFLGFMIYYLHHLSLPKDPDRAAEHLDVEDPRLLDLSPIPSQVVPPRHGSLSNGSTNADIPPPRTKDGETVPAPPCLLLTGYSYGSMILTSLPPLSSALLTPFQTPSPASPHEEIRLRALHLATQQNDIFTSYIHSLSLSQPRTPVSASPSHGNVLTSPKLRKSNPSVRVGGDENSRRASHDSYRSRNSFTVDTPEKLRKSIDRVRSITRSNRRGPSGPGIGSKASSNEADASTPEGLKPIPDLIQDLKVAYILISPLQGLIHNLATMWTSPSSSSFKSSKHMHSLPSNELKLVTDPTLALFGDDDIFVGVKKLRRWAARLRDAEAAVDGEGQRYFVSREVEGAGHFWHGSEAVKVLREEVGAFVREL